MFLGLECNPERKMDKKDEPTARNVCAKMPHEFLQLGRLTIFRALSSSHRCGLVGLKDVRWRLQSVTHPSPSHQEVFILCGDDQLATIATWEWNGIPLCVNSELSYH